MANPPDPASRQSNHHATHLPHIPSFPATRSNPAAALPSDPRCSRTSHPKHPSPRRESTGEPPNLSSITHPPNRGLARSTLMNLSNSSQNSTPCSYRSITTTRRSFSYGARSSSLTNASWDIHRRTALHRLWPTRGSVILRHLFLSMIGQETPWDLLVESRINGVIQSARWRPRILEMMADPRIQTKSRNGAKEEDASTESRIKT